MEMANLHLTLRFAGKDDAGAVAQFLRSTGYGHVHVDWRLPGEWLGTEGFVLAETTRDHVLGAGELQACLAVGADPPPAAWVRVAAVREEQQSVSLLSAMLQEVRPYLAEQGVSQLGWLPRMGWPAEWLQALAFEQVDEVVTFVRVDLENLPDVPSSAAARLRPVQPNEFARLAAIEEAAFDPLWRHSAEGLRLGWRQATSFDVALLDERIVGFQYSAPGDVQDAGHLVRLTVDPEAQRAGIGSALLLSALHNYRRQGLREASLNTQLSNEPSRRLYEKFGFEMAGHRWPVWRLSI